MDPQLWDRVREIDRITDDAERAEQADALLGDYHAAWAELARIRKEAVLNLHDGGRGLSYAQIAERLGMSRSRVGQITRSGPPPERAFLGSGNLTIAMGRKAGEGTGEPMVAVETLKAISRLTALAKTHQLDVTEDDVPPPGLVDLNRDNLIVIGGPRLFPLVGQILQSDRHLRFDTGKDGRWFLRDLDTGTEFRSPRDVGENRDYAYLGRLPRPDGAGTFLCIAGLHAIASQGAVAYLESSMADLYAQVKTNRFSMLIECEYDPNTLIATAAKAASPIYRS
ncbi:sigma factor-like helix-turn-helix DNA-binding protein [Actinomadura terrae]|uniref:sigma factor-like helix-turn-helix DNA-binding protein n=1 Tax=Actinomadura terrae TaxID=604353 RepID=UPI001FA77166|nr:sigma factor-like helix-turn-helix DNA-binding protein [Actinomadura terrae]